MALKIKTEVAGYGPRPADTHALINVFVEFNGPSESMAMTVLVPNEGDDSALLGTDCGADYAAHQRRR
jgi:hypothetical protein